MTAATYNLVIDQGSDFAVDLTITEGETIKDLTGYSARSHIRAKITDSALAASFTCTVLDPVTEGKLKMELPNGVSSEMAPGRYFYDLELFTANDVIVKRLLKGEITINAEVTR